MTEEGVKKVTRSITLTIDADSYTPATVDIAVAMAASLNARLQGLFIEDTDLLRMADLPCSTEITFPFARQRALNKSSLQRSLQALGAQARDYLAKTAERSCVQWSFSTISGKRSEAGLADTDESELLIIGQASSYHAPALLQPHSRHILLIDDHSPALLAALKVILKQTATMAMEIVLIGGKRAEPPENIEETLRDNPNILITRLESNDVGQIIKLVAMSPDYVIISRYQPLSLIQKIVHESVCPVILVTTP
ncbi:MAG TPA: hypothetical protein DDW45_09585 [Gammaproteobacteria bacterium]|nr:hypothetical protein [Gammaproteobacteria bacterium]